MGEDLQAQGVEDAFAGAAGHPGLADLRGPLHQDDDQAEAGGDPDGAQREPVDALVDAVPDQDRQHQAAERVEGDQQEADQQRKAEAAQQGAQAEAGSRPGPVLVHVRGVGGRRQRVDLGEQLGVAGMPASAPAIPWPGGAAGTARATGSADRAVGVLRAAATAQG